MIRRLARFAFTLAAAASMAACAAVLALLARSYRTRTAIGFVRDGEQWQVVWNRGVVWLDIDNEPQLQKARERQSAALML